MELNNYRLLKVPFVSKKKSFEILGVGSRRPKYSFSGNAYYLVETKNWTVVWERAILNEAEFRVTDRAMEKTRYYKQLFEKKNIDRKEMMGWTKSKTTVISKANKIQLERINEYSLNNIKTVLNIEGLITGSNPSGADYKKTNSPILIDPRLGSDYIRFVNAIKQIRNRNKEFERIFKEVFKKVSDIEKVFKNNISINQLASKNEQFRKWMKIYNFDVQEFKAEDKELLLYMEKVKISDIRRDVNHLISMNKIGLLDSKKLEKKLRKEFRLALINEAIEKGYSEYTGNKELSIHDTEASHIIDVSIIKKNNLNYSLIADPDNGLLLSPTLHSILDKNKIKLNENGTLTPISDEYSEMKNIKISDEIMNNRRRRFAKERNRYLGN